MAQKMTKFGRILCFFVKLWETLTLLHRDPCLAVGVGWDSAVIRGLVADDVIVHGAEALYAGNVKAGCDGGGDVLSVGSANRVAAGAGEEVSALVAVGEGRIQKTRARNAWTGRWTRGVARAGAEVNQSRSIALGRKRGLIG